MPVRSEKDFGEAVRAARQQLGWRQVDLARKASVRQPLVSDVENGASSARLETVLKILAALDMDLSLVARKKEAFAPTEY